MNFIYVVFSEVMSILLVDELERCRRERFPSLNLTYDEANMNKHYTAQRTKRKPKVRSTFKNNIVLKIQNDPLIICVILLEIPVVIQLECYGSVLLSSGTF